jgi:UDP-sugar transporter A1/2/3
MVLLLLCTFHCHPIPRLRFLHPSSRRWIRILSAAWNDLFGPTSEYKKVLVPALLYYIQNNLQYIAVSLLDAATFQVTYQLKILTTALFSVGMLGKRPSFLEWVALVILTGGVALVQLPSTSSSSTSEADLEDNMIDSSSTSLEAASRLMGLMAVIIACVLSGLAGVWFEKVLKGSKASLWVRNTQLALFSLIIGFISGGRKCENWGKKYLKYL